jgi:hypothetical protein
MKNISICVIKDCEGVNHAKGLCHKHYLQLKKHGKIFARTRYDKTKVVCEDDVTYVLLFNEDGEEKARAIIDNDEADQIKKYKWYLSNTGYATAGGHLLMHRLINKTPEGVLTDHINRNKLDNRKVNLRNCDSFDNVFNRGAVVTSKSRIRGVYYHKQTGKWTAEITYRKKRYYLGLFNTQAEAKAAYDKQIELFT